MPPSGFRQSAVNHVVGFCRDNYKALQEEVRRGKHPSMEVAMEREVERLDKFLLRLHLDEEGRLVDKDTGEKLQF